MTATPESRTEANREVIRRAFAAWQDGTRPITDVFAPDMVWRIEGHSLASKEYADTQQFIDEVLAPFGARFSTTSPFRPAAVRAIHADGDTVIVLWDGRGTANDGSVYENSYAWFMTLRDDKVVDGTAFYDSISFNDLWTRVAPRPCSPARFRRIRPRRFASQALAATSRNSTLSTTTPGIGAGPTGGAAWRACSSVSNTTMAGDFPSTGMNQ